MEKNDTPLCEKNTHITQGQKKLTLDDIELDDFDKALIKIIVEHPHLSKKQIAEVMNAPYDKVKYHTYKPVVKKTLNQFHSSAMELLTGAHNQAAMKIISLLQSKDQRVALEAAKTVLKNLLDNKIDMNITMDVNVRQQIQTWDMNQCLDYFKKITQG